MSDLVGLEMDIENHLLDGNINLEKALGMFTSLSIQAMHSSKQVSEGYVASRKVAIRNRMISGFEQKQFPISIFSDAFYQGVENDFLIYNFREASAPVGEIFYWAHESGISIPEKIYKKVFPQIHKKKIVGNQADDEPLSGKERQELALLQLAKSKWDDSIQAAVKVGMEFADRTDGKVITRDELIDFVHNAGYKTLPNTTIDKIWKALPKEIRCKGGRPPGSKNVH